MKIIFNSEEQKGKFINSLCPEEVGLKNDEYCLDGVKTTCSQCWEKSGLEYEIKNEESVNMQSLKEFYETPFVDLVYMTVKSETLGLDSIYRDYIVNLVGVMGLNALIEHNLVEGCGIVNGRKLYVLCDKEVK